MQSLDKIEKKMDKKTKSSRSGNYKSHDKKRRIVRTEVLANNTITLQGIPLGVHVVVQFLSKNLRRLGWMNFRGEMKKIKPLMF
jgi:hypothetical protein